MTELQDIADQLAQAIIDHRDAKWPPSRPITDPTDLRLYTGLVHYQTRRDHLGSGEPEIQT